MVPWLIPTYWLALGAAPLHSGEFVRRVGHVLVRHSQPVHGEGQLVLGHCNSCWLLQRLH